MGGGGVYHLNSLAQVDIGASLHTHLLVTPFLGSLVYIAV